jgi:hypothetical protein
MAIKEERTFEEKKNGMKITDNMDGDKKADEKLQAKYEPGSNVSDIKYEIYKKAFKEDRVKDIFPNEPIRNIRKMYDRLMEETGGKKPE